MRLPAIILTLIVSGGLVLQTPKVQTAVAAHTLETLQRSLNGKISTGDLQVDPFCGVMIRDVLIEGNDPANTNIAPTDTNNQPTDTNHAPTDTSNDPANTNHAPTDSNIAPTNTINAPADTICYIKNLYVTLTLRGLLSDHGAHIGRLTIDGGFFHLDTRQGAEIPTNICRVFGIVPKTKPLKTPGPDVFDIRRLKIDNFAYLMTIHHRPEKQKRPYGGYGINWDDLELTNVSIHAHSIRMTGGRIHAAVDRISGHEKSGYNIHRLRGRVDTGLGRTIVENIRLKDDWSEVYIPRYVMQYRHLRHFSDYVNKIRMDIELGRSDVDVRSVSYFSPSLKGNDLRFDIQGGNVSGYVSDLRARYVKFAEKKSGVTGLLSCSFIGLSVADTDDILLEGLVHNLKFTMPSLERFLAGLAKGKRIPALKNLSRKARWTMTGSVRGPIRKLYTNVNLTSREAGQLKAGLDIRDCRKTGGKPIKLAGTIDAKSLDAGLLTGSDKIGKLSLSAKGRISTAPGRLSCTAEKIHVSSAELMGYTYKDITASGKIKDKIIDGAVIINDDNLKLALEGSFDPKGKDGFLGCNLKGRIGAENLSSLGLLKRNTISGISLGIDVSGKGVLVDSLVIAVPDGPMDLGKLSLTIGKLGGMHTAELSSGFINGRYTGSFPVKDLPGALSAATLGKSLPALLKKAPKFKDGEFGSINLSLLDTYGLISSIKPGLYIASGTDLECRLDTDGSVSGKLKSPRLAKGNNFVRNVTLDFESRDGLMKVEAEGDDIEVKGTALKSFKAGAGARRDSIRAEISFHGNDSTQKMESVRAEAQLRRTNAGQLGTGFRIATADSCLLIYGDVEKCPKDSICVSIDNLDLSILNSLLVSDLGLGGTANGSARIYAPFCGAYQSKAGFNLDSLKSAGKPIGNMKAVCGWDNELNQLNLYATAESAAGKQTFALAGHLNPSDGSIDVHSLFEDFDLSAAAPALAGTLDGLSGGLSGKVEIGGTLKHPNIRTDGLKLSDASARLSATGVTYTINGEINLSQSGAVLDGLKISDSEDGIGNLTGTVSFAGEPKGLILDTKLQTRHLKVLDISRNASASLRGSLYANSDLKITGKDNIITVSGGVITAGKGDIYITTGSSTASSSDILTFEKEKTASEAEAFEQSRKKDGGEEKKPSRVLLDINVKALEQTEALIELGKVSGSYITARGSGNINVANSLRGGILITGDYILSGGKYHFVLPGAMITKEFSIRSGSSIKLNGDLKSTTIDLTAVYSLKASISTLLASTSSESRRNVECIIHMHGSLDALEIDFDLNIPDLDPTTQSRVDLALNTEDKVQKQFMALLIMGTFLPEESSGIVNGTNVLYSNMGEIMAGQFNSVLQRLGIPLDLGLGYQQNSRGTDIFDVAISTELFNNRVVVNGNVGNRDKAMSGDAQSAVVGDVDVEVKIDRPGNIRVKAFSHSADEHTSFIDSSQRNGIGLTYQQDFDNFWKFLRYVFSSKAKKQEITRQNLEKQKDRIITKISE